jgi:hypothetical protein
MLRLLFSYSFNLTERRSAIARHPDASSLDAAIQLTAAAMLLKEGPDRYFDGNRGPHNLTMRSGT